jgi:pseudoazurin
MKYLCIILFGFFIANVSLAEDATVEMLDKLEKRKMVFNQEIVRIDPGDTVFWKATDRGHNVEFISKNGVPDGVEKFKSKVGKDTEFTFTIPGIYAYWCVPHKTLGMIGFVIVGDDLSNLDSIKKVKFIGKSKKIAKGLIAEIEG